MEQTKIISDNHMFNESSIIPSVLIKVVGWMIVFITPIVPSALALLGLLIGDFITGIWASIHVNGWSSISSRRMGDSITKITLYWLAIFVTHLVETHLIPVLPILRIMIGFIAATELKSVFENINKIIKVDLWIAIKNTLNRSKNGES